MGTFEWAMSGGTYAVVILLTSVVSALEVRKSKKALPKIGREILRVRTRLWIPVFFAATGLLSLLGGTATLICCSILIEPAPKGAYALVLALLAFLALLCAAMVLYFYVNFTSMTDEGVWVFRIFLKPKFVEYRKIVQIQDNSAVNFSLGGGYIFYGKNRKKLFSLAAIRERGVNRAVALVCERMSVQPPAEEIFTL